MKNILDDRDVGLNLLENAYSFVNEAIRCGAGAIEDSVRWKFALVHSSQALELILKERLRQEHPLLVYVNVDKPKITVSLEAAIDRLSSCGMPIRQADIERIQQAKNLRNAIVHFNIEVTNDQFREAFIDLFEFAHEFHKEEVGDELHDHIDPALWEEEAAIIEAFKDEMTVYQGEEVVKWHPMEIVQAQLVTDFELDDEPWSRIRYGDEPAFCSPGDAPELEQLPNCHDCAVRPGQFHARGCDCERCPRCARQLLTCDCGWEEPHWFFSGGDHGGPSIMPS